MIKQLTSLLNSSAFGNAAPIVGSVMTGMFNQRSANKQMRFQDVSSRNQYQRAMRDMRAAGLNPMLAAKLGGNAAMSGASASMPDLGATINSAENLRQMRPIREAETALKELEVDIKKLKDVPAARVKGFADRIISQAIEVIDDYVKLTGSHGFSNTQLESVENVLNSLKRTSIQAFIETLQGIDKGTLKILEGFDWFKSMIEDL